MTNAQDNFYEHVNRKWLDAPENQIPPEYPRWGGFIVLHDQSLKDQINLVKNIEAMPLDQLNDDQTKILAIWKASNKRFEQWRSQGDADANQLAPILEEFATLEEHYRLTEPLGLSALRKAQYIHNMANYLYYTQVNGIPNFMNFDKGSDLTNSNNVVLDVSGAGLSLPSRDYYLDDNFASKRNLFRQHLENVVKLVNSNMSNANTNNNFRLTDNFVDNVISFETELAKIKMKQDQNRRYDEYYTNSTLDGFYKDLNTLKSLDDKQLNYEASDRDFKLEQQALHDVKHFMERVYDLFDFRKILAENYKKNFIISVSDNKYELLSDEPFHLTVYDGDYFRRLFSILLNQDNYDKLMAYHQYKIISEYQSYCGSNELNEEFFDFYSRKLNGQMEQKPEEKRSIQVVNEYAGEMLGKVYVSKYFPESSKLQLKEMITNILTVMNKSIETSDWLTQATKEKAIEKLDRFVSKIGYPDKWKDYSDLKINVGDSLYKITKELKRWLLQTEFYDKLNTVLDRTAWLMTPQTVNAYFMPPQNEIVFPAAILQPPFFHSVANTIDFDYTFEQQLALEYNIQIDWTIPVNFGAIGAVIAHEITHGYDDKGRKYDKDGNLNDWWTEEDADLFLQKTVLMREQTDKYQYIDANTQKVYPLNGDLTMGENLADLGGLSLSKKGMFKLLEATRGLSADKSNYHVERHIYLRVFFKSFANVWKQNTKPDFKINQMTTDPHAPADFRANMVKNIDDFYEVFNVKPGDNMYLEPAKRVQMW